VAAKDVDAAARAVIEAAGYGDRFPHGVGHGLGIRVHEAPFSGDTSEDVFAVGHVTTVEPGIYLPDWGGVRIEDVGVVEDGGFRVFTRAPKPSPTRERSLVP
jgi:Xaa-Pro aminopeptidase